MFHGQTHHIETSRNKAPRGARQDGRWRDQVAPHAVPGELRGDGFTMSNWYNGTTVLLTTILTRILTGWWF